MQGQNIEVLFRKLLAKSAGIDDFDQLPVPFRAVAADIETGLPVVLKSGDLTMAARASMSVPGFFAPVEIDGRVLVDGGVTNNFPVDIALGMGVDVLIAVKLDVPLRPRDKLSGPLAISAQILDMLMAQTSERGLQKMRSGDLLIRPDITKYSSTSFKDAAAILKAGEEAAQAMVGDLKRLSWSLEEYRNYNQRRTGGQEYLPVVQFIGVGGIKGVRQQRLENRLQPLIGVPLQHEAVAEVIRDEYQSGEFEKIEYRLARRNGELGVVVEAKEKEWLKNFVRVGFSLEDDLGGTSAYSLGLNARLNDLNSWGGYSDLQLELGRNPRAFSEFYQPLGEQALVFIAPEVEIARRTLTVRQNGTEVARYFRDIAHLGMKTGIALGRYGELSVGLRRGTGELRRDIGDPALPEFDYDIGEWTTRLVFDQLDNPDFPTEGFRFSLSGLAARDNLGASDEYEQGRIISALPLTFGSTTLLLRGELGASSGGIPVEQSFGLGGLFDVSGFVRGSLTADNFWAGRTILYNRFAKGNSSLLPFGGFWGGSVEVVSIRTEAPAIGDLTGVVAGSVFVGLDTPILPVYLAFGLNDESERSFYFNVGRLGISQR